MISKNGNFDGPPRSPDLTPLDFFHGYISTPKYISTSQSFFMLLKPTFAEKLVKYRQKFSMKWWETPKNELTLAPLQKADIYEILFL